MGGSRAMTATRPAEYAFVTTATPMQAQTVVHRKRLLLMCARHSDSVLDRMRRLLRQRPRAARPPPPRRRTSGRRWRDGPITEEWEALIVEFEEHASRDGDVGAEENGGNKRPPTLNAAQFAMVPHTESAFMVALTTVLWWLGRVLRLDAVLLLFYPLPTMYLAARHGLHFVHASLAATILLVLSLVGPLYAALFVLNTGLLTLAYARALWHRLNWYQTLLVASAAKAVGLALQLSLMSSILRVDSWTALTAQLTNSLTAVCTVLARVGIAVSAPPLRLVQVAVVAVVALHSLYHVFFTQLTITLLLRRIADTESLSRVPPDMPLVRLLLRRSRLPP